MKYIYITYSSERNSLSNQQSIFEAGYTPLTSYRKVSNPIYLIYVSLKPMLHIEDREKLGKFDYKCHKDIVLDYSLTSQAYRVFNLIIKTVMQSNNVIVDDASLHEVEVRGR